MPKSKIALFIDAENLTKWIKEAGPEDLLSDLGISGQIITRRAYGVWSQPNLISLQSSLNQLGFELIHSYHPVKGKNSTDIQMTVDIMEHALRLQDVEWFVLATGDSDFSPLFRKLREMGKEVIGVGPKSPLSESVKTSCSRYIYTDNPQQDNILDYDSAADLVEKILDNSSVPFQLGTLKITLLNSNPAFNEKNLGYSSFLNFVNSIGNIKTWSEDGQTDWYAQKTEIKMPEKTSINQKTTPASIESYTNILRRLNWRIVPKDTIIQIHAKLKKMIPSERGVLIELLLQALAADRPNITPTEIRKAIAIFTKSGLLTSNDRSLLEYQYKIDYRYYIDKAIIARLVSGCNDSNIQFDINIAKEFLYALYKDEQSLLKIYSEAISAEQNKKTTSQQPA